MADLQKIAEEIVEKIKKDPKLLQSFKSDPVKTLESMSGIDLPDGGMEAAAAIVKAKLAGGDVKDVLKKLF